MSGRQVLIVEDHPLFVQAVSELVARLDRNAQLRSAHTLADALAALEGGWLPDFVLLDLNLPDAAGLEGVRQLRQRLPWVPVMVVSALDDPEVRRKLRDAGIGRFVSKSARPAEFIESVRQMLQLAPEATADSGRQPTSLRTPLSQRQVEVLREMATGKSNKEIARGLEISVETVRAHVVEILARLGVRNRTEAVMVFYSGRFELPQ
ncbi:MAG: response regulator transcription factor [Rhodocyclaceae bacterium]|nr:response regulator transcription factor [Rhodocyclaceae bacterium]